jgi:hypothetical protein
MARDKAWSQATVEGWRDEPHGVTTQKTPFFNLNIISKPEPIVMKLVIYIIPIGGPSENLKNDVFWDVTLCGSCNNRRFGGT